MASMNKLPAKPGPSSGPKVPLNKGGKTFKGLPPITAKR